MEFSLFTLTLGSFLMVLPYLSEGAITVTKSMPSNEAKGSEMKVICAFEVENPTSGTNEQVMRMSLLRGGSEPIVAEYIVSKLKFELVSTTNGIKLEIGSETTVTKGSLTFVIDRLVCTDFTWYVCRGGGMESQNSTLQVIPKIISIRDTVSRHIVHSISDFICIGTVSIEGPYSVKWYRKTFAITNQLTTNVETKETGRDQCSRTIQSTLSYNVTETDVPSLLLWCRLEGGSGYKIDKSGNFTIQEMTTVAATISPQAVKAGLGAGSIVGIVLGITATIVLVVLLVWFLVVRPKRLKAEGPSKDQGPEPNAKDYQVQDNVLYATVDPLKKEEDRKGKVNPALDDKNDGDNAPYTVYPSSKYELPPGGHENPAMDQDMPNHMGGSTV